MHLYNLTLQRPTAAIQAIVGNFSGSREQELIVSHGTSLELFGIDAHTGKMSSVVVTDIFASIRSIAAFRLAGNTTDYVIIGSDSGRIVILEFSADAAKFIKLHQETYGKSGARRVVPGQFVATDPKGRSVMISALEKSKLVYILNRDAAANLTISSPLEAHAEGCIIHHIVGLDVGFENPMFAVLEVDYTESDQDASKVAQKMLRYYELDLCLNHVVRKWSAQTDSRANLLVQVPGGQDGPSGVLVCCEDHVVYQNINTSQHRIPIPRREGTSMDRGLLIVSAVMHKMKNEFFFLLQSELGDLYKVTVEHSDDEVHSLKIKYFDTVPVSTSLCVLRSGFLFVASEFGNQQLYQFQTLGEDDAQTECSSATYKDFGMSEPSAHLPRVFFRPRAPENLKLVDEIVSLDPIIDSQVLNVSPRSDSPQIFAACGRGPRSSFRTLRHGLGVEELVNCDVLPSSPIGVWTTKRIIDRGASDDAYIIFSFQTSTSVLSIKGEEFVEVQDTSFLLPVPTLAVQQLGSDSLVQVHPSGVRRILSSGKIQEWTPPSGLTIVTAATNTRQIAVALSSTEIVYFELDLDSQLNECEIRKPIGSPILALGIGAVEEGRQRYPYLSVGCEDQTVRILSLDPEHALESVGLQTLLSPPSSICTTGNSVHVGLQNGVLLQTVLDTNTGQLGDTRYQFLGTRPVRLSRVVLQDGIEAILALSSRSWIGCNRNKTQTTAFMPLLYVALEHACSFVHDICPNGLIGTAGSVLRIFRLPKVEDSGKLHQDSVPLCHTPRQMICHPSNNYFYIVESDNRVVNDPSPAASITAETWSSSIHILDPAKRVTIACIPLDHNEAAFSIAIVPFSARLGELMLVVGTATDVVQMPRSFTSAFLQLYKFRENGELELHYKTEVDDIPLALLAFQGRLAAGVGRALRIYDIGKHRMLCKAENKSFASSIVTLHTQGSRIVVGDMEHSLNFITYKASDNRLLVVADDTQPRWTTCSTMLDYNTVAAGDRFGNIFVNRLDSGVSEAVDADPTGAALLRQKSLLKGAPHKTRMLAHFHLGDLPTSIHKTTLVAGAGEVILYTGLHGTIGMLVPLSSKDDIDFLSALEQHIRAEQGSPVGRDHLSWRGYYVPVKGVVDGDLCETFHLLSGDQQRTIAAELDRTVTEVGKKLAQIRAMSSGF
ncbi:CPSF A subunit region-domain-containing protein [Mycena sanguinolenta]|nr:CPSF A subunit region-domain-containing protein [Mycena sanguinolenta]